MPVSIYHVDAFTNEPFRGNPAAVCLLHEPAEDGWMQSIAAEMNLSETAFVHPAQKGFALRWFTPKVEVDLCGHATLATAHVLFGSGIVEGLAEFQTKSGLLTARKLGDWIELDFPLTPEQEIKPPPGLSAALGMEPKYVGDGKWMLLVEADSETTVRELKPDFSLIERLDFEGIAITAHSDSGEYDFVSRFFAPRMGIDEDPVTGSAHTCLAPFWQKRLGKDTLDARQVSARGGMLRVRVEGDRVYIGGQAVTVYSGVIPG